MSEGYKLADGSLSTDYKVGDKFIVSLTGDRNDGKQAVLYEDNSSGYPDFILDMEVRRIRWFNLLPVEKRQKQEGTSDVTQDIEKEQYILVRGYTTGNAALKITSVENLQDGVNHRMKEGYVTQGGLTEAGGVIMQAMVLQENKTYGVTRS